MRNTLRDAATADKLAPEDKQRLERLVSETIDWLDHNQLAEEEVQGRSFRGGAAVQGMVAAHSVCGSAH